MKNSAISYQLSAISHSSGIARYRSALRAPSSALLHQSTIRGSTELAEVNPQSAISPRSAFTLTEMLVVMGVMAFLIAISVTIYSGTGTAARRSATVATVKKIDELLHSRLDGFQRWINTLEEEALERAGDKWNLGDGGNPPDGSRYPRSELLGRKRYLSYYFPQRLADTQLPAGDSQYFPNPMTIPSGTDVAATESAELLYFFLTQGQSYGAEPVGDDAFGTGEVGDTDGDGLREFIDGWGRPLRFYRWPTRLIRGGAWSASAYAVPPIAQRLCGTVTVDTTDVDAMQDPDDTLGLITAFVNATPMTAPAQFETRYHTADTYHAPLVVSAGPDGWFGLYDPTNVAEFGYLAAPLSNMADEDPDLTAEEEAADNITNLNQRAGSR